MGEEIPVGSGPTSTSGGFTRAFLREGHGWVAALAAVASVVVSVIFATGGGSSGMPTGTATATASPTPYLAAATAPSSGASSPSAGASSEISAACVGCTDAERTIRQSALDTLTARLAAITDESCNDTTETFGARGAAARIGCSFPGGVDADYVLWSDADALAARTTDVSATPDALVQEWRLFGPSSPKTGTTVEWLDAGTARFYWTYDRFLISGDAARREGGQQLLNDWWRTSGSLLRE